MTMSHGARERVGIWRLLSQLLSKQVVRRIEILGYNKTNFILIKNLESQDYINHINLIHHYMKEHIKDEESEVKWILSYLIFTNELIKTLSKKLFKRYWKEWGLVMN